VNPQRLYRSSDDRWIAGVAAGVADYFDVDPVLARVIWLILVPLTGGIALLAYLIMIVVVPLEPGEMPPQAPWQPGGAPLGYPGAYAAPAPAATDPAATPAGPTTTVDPFAGAAGQAPEGGSAAPQPGAPGPAPLAGAPGPGPTPGWDWRWQSRQDRWQRRADRWQQRNERWQERSERRGSGGILFGVLLIVIGGLLAWHTVDPQLDLNLAWPIAAIVFGVFLVVSSVGYRRGQ
jgi:phage shock protein PspC (stress-responsive transcriptional regulator)